MDCLEAGSKAVCQGESSLSAKQRHSMHRSALVQGLTSSPLVHHALEVHGGIKLQYVAVIRTLEPKPLQRVVREAVHISCQPSGPANLNRCMEWGCPWVPVLRATGGDNERDKTRPSEIQELTANPNPRPNWSRRILEMVKEGRAAKVRLRQPGDREGMEDRDVIPEDLGETGRIKKRQRMDEVKDDSMTARPAPTETKEDDTIPCEPTPEINEQTPTTSIQIQTPTCEPSQPRDTWNLDPRNLLVMLQWTPETTEIQSQIKYPRRWLERRGNP